MTELNFIQKLQFSVLSPDNVTLAIEMLIWVPVYLNQLRFKYRNIDTLYFAWNEEILNVFTDKIFGTINSIDRKTLLERKGACCDTSILSNAECKSFADHGNGTEEYSKRASAANLQVSNVIFYPHW